MGYGEDYRARMVKRMQGPYGQSATSLSKEVGVSQNTLSKWLRVAQGRDTPRIRNKRMKNDEKRSAEDKFRIVTTASILSDDELGAYLRTEGVHHAQLEQWRRTILLALAPRTAPLRADPRLGELRKETLELKRELRRKEKALAETAALLVLKKKAQALLWEDEDDDTQQP